MSNLFYHKKIVKIHLWKARLDIIITNDVEKVEINLGPVVKEGFKELYAHACYRGGSNEVFSIILNPDHSFANITIGTIAHEALHATNQILYNRGVVADFDNDEAQAYLLDYIISHVHQYMDKMGYPIN